MTKISYIQGIPQNEAHDRGNNTTGAGYIPYLSLTEGEMRLELLRQRMQLFSQYYPDVPEYRKAVSMIENVLHAGIHGGVSFMGSIPDEIQHVARVIAQAVGQTRPATGGQIIGRESISGIIPVGDSEARKKACLDTVRKTVFNLLPNNFDPKNFPQPNIIPQEAYDCWTNFEIEQLYNDYLEKIGLHTVYNRISQSYSKTPSRVFTKSILHDSGISGLANVANINYSLISDWMENGVMQKNALLGLGPIGSVPASFYLSSDPEKNLAAYNAWFNQWQKDRPGGIGFISLQNIQTIAAAIVAVIGVAFAFLTSLKKYKAYALNEAKGFGTDAFAAYQSDWIAGQDNPTTGEKNNQTLTLLAAATGAYLVLND